MLERVESERKVKVTAFISEEAYSWLVYQKSKRLVTQAKYLDDLILRDKNASVEELEIRR